MFEWIHKTEGNIWIYRENSKFEVAYIFPFKNVWSAHVGWYLGFFDTLEQAKESVEKGYQPMETKPIKEKLTEPDQSI